MHEKQFILFRHEGEGTFQGQITRVTSDEVTIQLFGWVDGAPTDRRTYRIDDLSGVSIFNSSAMFMTAAKAAFDKAAQ